MDTTGDQSTFTESCPQRYIDGDGSHPTDTGAAFSSIPIPAVAATLIGFALGWFCVGGRGHREWLVVAIAIVVRLLVVGMARDAWFEPSLTGLFTIGTICEFDRAEIATNGDDRRTAQQDRQRIAREGGATGDSHHSNVHSGTLWPPGYG